LIAQGHLFGYGPNRFVQFWNEYKPKIVNETALWNTDFMYGSGWLPTMFVTFGLIPSMAILGFMLFLLWYVARVLWKVWADPAKEYVAILSGLLVLYFWTVLALYTPSIVPFFFAALCTGLFLATLRNTAMHSVLTWNMSKNPRYSFIPVAVFVCIVGLSIYSLYEISRRSISVYYYNHALVEANQKGNIDDSEKYIRRALGFYNVDVYLRTYSQLYISKTNQLLSLVKEQKQTEVPKEEVKARFTEYISQAKTYAEQAVAFSDEPLILSGTRDAYTCASANQFSAS
jgi:hypothetical protein